MRLAYYSLAAVFCFVWGALAATGCGAQTSEGGGTDSNTHWLGRCTANADCDGELSCICGACTRECVSNSSCESLDDGALCLDVQCNESDQAVCTLGCSTESDCPSGANCEGGACVPRLAEVSSSDDPDAGGPVPVNCDERSPSQCEADDKCALVTSSPIDPERLCALPEEPFACVRTESEVPCPGAVALFTRSDGTCWVNPSTCVAPFEPFGAPSGACSDLSGSTTYPDCPPDEPSTYEPCAGKGCGDDCTLCDPGGDTACMEHLEAKYCNADGSCGEPHECPTVSDGPCDPTSFEDAGECTRSSWIWDGSACTEIGHCLCASGECDRLYDDEAACRAAHAECLPPDECAAQDARSSGDDCISLDGYSFNGTECEPINCGCSGTECDEVSASLGDCEGRFRACLEPAPMCTDDVFPVVDEDPALSPAYPEFTFEVVEQPELFDEEAGEVTIFADWTPALWLGAEDLIADPPTCSGVGDEETTPCPYPREFALSVEGEPVTMVAVLKWDQIELPPTNSDVEVLIERHPRGSLSFRVRNPQTMLPLLMIVQRGEASQLEDGWEFPPFTFSPGATLCQAPSAACDWVFLAQSLDVEVDFDSRSSIAPLQVGLFPAEASGGNVDYQVSHSAFFVQTFEGDMSCAALYSSRQSFAFSPVTAEE